MDTSERFGGNKKVVITQDCSQTLFSTQFNESYHSTKDGALHESLVKHVKQALAFAPKKEKLTILDICFGLGYNTFATIYFMKQEGLRQKVHILSPEFDEALVRSLKHFEYPSEFDMLQPMIQAISDTFYYEDEQFKIEVLIGDARESIPQIKEKVNIVYQDAFSPKQNPLLWTKEYFAQVRAICDQDVVLTTYSVATAIRMGLWENGFHIFEQQAQGVRDFTIASLKVLPLKEIDMVLKKLRNPVAKSLHDIDYS